MLGARVAAGAARDRSLLGRRGKEDASYEPSDLAAGILRFGRREHGPVLRLHHGVREDLRRTRHDLCHGRRLTLSICVSVRRAHSPRMVLGPAAGVFSMGRSRWSLCGARRKQLTGAQAPWSRRMMHIQ